jgi:hypothetical protein
LTPKRTLKGLKKVESLGCSFLTPDRAGSEGWKSKMVEDKIEGVDTVVKKEKLECII